MAFKDLRLKRTLRDVTLGGWTFALTASTFTETDDTIQSVKIHRGSNGRNVGHNPSTCEVQVAGRRDGFYTGNQLRFFMREQPADRIAAYLGTTGAAIAQRFSGRLGKVALEDYGKKFDTTLSASSFLTQMNYSPASFTPTAGQTLASLLLDMTKANEPVRGIDFGTALGDVQITNFAAGEPQLYREGISKYIADIGVMIQDRRDGSALAWSHFTRYDLAQSRLATEWPLMRNQAIAPGHYEQANERPARIVDYKIVNSSGGTVTRRAEVENPTGELREVETADFSTWQVGNVDNQLYREAYARVFQSSARLYSLPSVKIDLLALIKHGGEYSRRIARQMLLLEVGEPIFLSGDWPDKLWGVHFADGITETITPTSWEIELSLITHAAAIGRVTPEVQPKAWDSALKAWDEETREWDQI